METLQNGHGKLDIFRGKYDTGEVTVLQGLTGDTEATERTHKAFEFEFIEEAPPQIQDDGTIKFALNQFQDDDALNEVLNKLAKPPAASGSLPERYTIAGVKHGGASGGDYIIGIYYGKLHPTDGVKMLVFWGKMAVTSGSYSDKHNEWSNPTVEFVGQIAPADVTLAAALFDATKINATEVATKIPKIAKGECYVREFVAVPA